MTVSCPYVHAPVARVCPPAAGNGMPSPGRVQNSRLSLSFEAVMRQVWMSSFKGSSAVAGGVRTPVSSCVLLPRGIEHSFVVTSVVDAKLLVVVGPPGGSTSTVPPMRHYSPESRAKSPSSTR